jgi:sn-glycerol 3-phosphate transport system substrate-binding protein
MELIWNGKKTPAQAIADASARSNEKLREFEKTNK